MVPHHYCQLPWQEAPTLAQGSRGLRKAARISLGGHFRPKKNICPPPPPKKFPTSLQTPFGPSRPGETPPPRLGFSKKNDPLAAVPVSRTHLPPSRAGKKSRLYFLGVAMGLRRLVQIVHERHSEISCMFLQPVQTPAPQPVKTCAEDPPQICRVPQEHPGGGNCDAVALTFIYPKLHTMTTQTNTLQKRE